MKLRKHIIRLTCRKEKKALKNYPCKKTKRGRYIIDVMDSSYDNGSIGIGYHNGCEIYLHDKGYEHPKGYFFNGLIKGTSPWKFNDDFREEEIDLSNDNLFDLI